MIFFLFHIEIEGKGGWIIGGAKGYVGPPSQIIGGGGGLAYAYGVNFQCRGVLQIWIIVRQGPIVFAVGAGGVVWTFFSLIYHFFFLSPSLWDID